MSNEVKKLAKAAAERISKRYDFLHCQLKTEVKGDTVYVEPLFPFMGVHEFGAKPNSKDAFDILYRGKETNTVETTARVIPDEPRQITINVKLIETDGDKPQ